MLEVKNICYSTIENGKVVHILKNISFKVKNKELVVITGPNGSGKSTLSKILMGILPATSGQIIYNGKDITNLSITDHAKLGFGYAFQRPVTFKGLTVKDLVDLATGTKNTIPDACEYLSKVGLCAHGYLSRELNGRLSGGELKRLELALVLAKNSDLNICDEPEAGIDLWSFDTLVRLFSQKKKTFIVISHQEKLIKVANKVILLNKGRITKTGTFEEISSELLPQICEKLEIEND